jgi:hypothetical protein
VLLGWRLNAHALYSRTRLVSSVMLGLPNHEFTFGVAESERDHRISHFWT